MIQFYHSFFVIIRKLVNKNDYVLVSHNGFYLFFSYDLFLFRKIAIKTLFNKMFFGLFYFLSQICCDNQQIIFDIKKFLFCFVFEWKLTFFSLAKLNVILIGYKIVVLCYVMLRMYWEIAIIVSFVLCSEKKPIFYFHSFHYDFSPHTEQIQFKS